MKTQAAILVELARPLELVELGIPPLKPGQVLVEMLYSGVCHTQVGEWLGWRGPDAFLPHCLGHEGSGRVLETAPGVTRCRAGDSVVLSWIKAGGHDVPGTVYDWNGKKVNAGGVTTFARHTVVSENRVSVVPASFPQRAAAMVGCAVATGFGAVLNTSRVVRGQSVVVLGVGGIGLCAVAAAKACGAGRIAAVDTRPARLQLARQLGATETVNAQQQSTLAALRDSIPSGWDVAIEATGVPQVMQTALSAVRARGGKAVIVGNARFGDSLTLDPREFNQGKQLLGTWGGDTNPDRDFPRYVEWIAGGSTPVEKIFEKEYSLGEINAALTDLHEGLVSRPLIDLQAV